MDTQLANEEELTDFFVSMYKETEGYVWAPTLDRELPEEDKSRWQNKFFKWPLQKGELIEHVIVSTPTLEVYTSPALFKDDTKGYEKSNVLGSHNVWAEFDGNIPEFNDESLRPAFWVNSSSREHLHVYWTLSEFCTNIPLLESVNRSLAYTLKADQSGWDATQILRPPHTYNHKRGVIVSRLQRRQDYIPVDILNLAVVPAPERITPELDTSNLPTILDVASRNANYSKSMWNLFQKKAEPGDRSDKLMSLAYYAAECRFPDLDMYALLTNAAQRWGKFEGRKDRKQRLIDIIDKARQKYPLESVNYGSLMGAQELLDSNIHMEWVFKDFLEEQGIAVLTGPPGIGKTQISLQFAIHAALGLDFLGYASVKPRKIIFFSLEMNLPALKYFLEKMLAERSVKERALLQENLKILPLGTSIPMDVDAGQKAIMEYVQEESPDGIFIDSMGRSIEEDINSNQAIKALFNFMDTLRKNHDCFIWFIHHQRKAQALNKKPKALSDMYGSQYIGANASAVVGIWQEGNAIEMSQLKVRLGPTLSPKYIMRENETLNFSVVDEPIMSGMIEAGKEAEGDESPGAPAAGLPGI